MLAVLFFNMLRTNYLKILSPVLNLLHCPTRGLQKTAIRKICRFLITDHLICELKVEQTALLLVRKYVADTSGADVLLA